MLFASRGNSLRLGIYPGLKVVRLLYQICFLLQSQTLQFEVSLLELEQQVVLRSGARVADLLLAGVGKDPRLKRNLFHLLLITFSQDLLPQPLLSLFINEGHGAHPGSGANGP